MEIPHHVGRQAGQLLNSYPSVSFEKTEKKNFFF